MKTMSALGVYAASVVTALTAQNTLGVTAIHAVLAEFVREQIRAVVGDIRPQAVKIGMLNDAVVAAPWPTSWARAARPSCSTP